MRRFGLAVALLIVSAFAWSGVILDDASHIESAWTAQDTGADIAVSSPDVAVVATTGEHRSIATVAHAEHVGSAGRYGTQIIQNRDTHPGIGYRVKNPPDE